MSGVLLFSLGFSDELFSGPQGVFGNLGASHEAGHFADLGILVQSFYVSVSGSLVAVLVDPVVMLSSKMRVGMAS